MERWQKGWALAAMGVLLAGQGGCKESASSAPTATAAPANEASAAHEGEGWNDRGGPSPAATAAAGLGAFGGETKGGDAPRGRVPSPQPGRKSFVAIDGFGG